MLTPDEELQSRAGGCDEGRPCANCGHPAHVGRCSEYYISHYPEFCAQKICQCEHYAPMSGDETH
jgi:hypothetical protein